MGFLLFRIYGMLMGLRLAALRAAGAPLIYGHDTASGCHTFPLTFLNRCISVKASPMNTKVGDFVNRSVLFLAIA